MEVDLEPDELREARGTIQFERDIFPLELARIAERQERVFGSVKPPLKRSARRAAAGAADANNEPPAVPSTDLGLMGLALSGGGIRSATFNLGVVQALNQRAHVVRGPVLVHEEHLEFGFPKKVLGEQLGGFGFAHAGRP